MARGGNCHVKVCSERIAGASRLWYLAGLVEARRRKGSRLVVGGPGHVHDAARKAVSESSKEGKNPTGGVPVFFFVRPSVVTPSSGNGTKGQQM